MHCMSFYILISPGKCLLPDGTKPLPESMLSSIGFCSTHLKLLSQEVIKISLCVISRENTLVMLLPNSSGTNEITLPGVIFFSTWLLFREKSHWMSIWKFCFLNVFWWETQNGQINSRIVITIRSVKWKIRNEYQNTIMIKGELFSQAVIWVASRDVI